MSTSTKSSATTTRAERRQAERIQAKLMKRLKKQFSQPGTPSLPKLSKIIIDYATPLYSKDASEIEIRAILNLVCSAWNLGRLSKDEQAELWPMVIAPTLAEFTDPAGALHIAVERIMAARTSDHGDDPRFVIHYKLQPLNGGASDKLHLQVASQPLSPGDYKSYIMKRMSLTMDV